MYKDPTQFRERFKRWKEGELVYENGLALPAYQDGKLSDEQYINIMEKVAADNYKKWGFDNEDQALLHALNDNTYNYRGYYNKYPNSSANADTHWTDEFKTVWHPTFSNESVYSGKKSQYNPNGLKGGHWEQGWFGEKFIPEKWQKNPKYEDGKLPKFRKGLTPYKKSEVNTNEATYNPEEDLYTARYTVPEVTITGNNRRKKWTPSQSPTLLHRRWLNLQPSELMYPFGLVGEAINTVPVIGPAFNEYVAPTLAAGNWIVGKGNPYKGAEMRALDERLLGAYLPFDFFIGPKIAGKISNPVFKSASNLTKRMYNEYSPWVWNIPENKNMAYRIMGPLEKDWLLQGNELSTRATNALTEAEEATARATEPKAGRFTLFKAGAEHGGRKQFAKGQPWKGTTTTHGEPQVLAIPGENLPWVSGRHYKGPQGHGFKVGDISFEEAPFGSHIDLQANTNGFTGINPSALKGSAIYSPIKIFGHKFGYRRQPIGQSKNTIGDNIVSTFKDKMNYLQSKKLLGDPSISEQFYMNSMRDWLKDLTTFMAPFRKKAHAGQTVGDVIDYNWGLYGGKNKLISELSDALQWSLLKTIENMEEYPKMRKVIHMDDSGPQPTNEFGFVPKDKTNSNSTWYTGGTPEIWWNRGKMYYNPQQWINSFDIPTTYIADMLTLENVGIKFPADLKNVLHAPGIVPYEAIDFALRPNPITGFFDKIKYLSK